MTKKPTTSKPKVKTTPKPADLKRLLRNAVLGGGIVFAIFGTISYSLYQKQDIEAGWAVLINGAIFACVAAAKVIYDIDQWPLTKRTLVHILLMIATIYPLLLISGWFPVNSVTDALLILILFATVGVIGWSIGWLICADNSPLRRKK